MDENSEPLAAVAARAPHLDRHVRAAINERPTPSEPPAEPLAALPTTQKRSWVRETSLQAVSGTNLVMDEAEGWVSVPNGGAEWLEIVDRAKSRNQALRDAQDLRSSEASGIDKLATILGISREALVSEIKEILNG